MKHLDMMNIFTIYSPSTKRGKCSHKEYHQKWFHVKAERKVLPMGVAFALLCGLVQIWIF